MEQVGFKVLDGLVFQGDLGQRGLVLKSHEQAGDLLLSGNE